MAESPAIGSQLTVQTAALPLMAESPVIGGQSTVQTAALAADDALAEAYGVQGEDRKMRHVAIALVHELRALRCALQDAADALNMSRQ